MLDSLTNGDGVGSLQTNVRFLDCSVKFDSAKAYSMQTVPSGSEANRATYLGEKVGTSGVWKGANLEFTGGGQITFRGGLFLYDSRIYHATQSIAIQPSVSGSGEIIQGTIELRGQGLNNLGTAAIAFGPIRGLALIHRVTTLNNVLNIPDCIGLTVYPISGSQYGLRPSGILSVNGLSFAKGAQSVADMFPISTTGGADWDVNNVTWSQIVPSFPATGPQTNFNIYEGATANFQVVTPGMVALANVALEIKDRFGVTVVDIDTDSNGKAVYNSGARANCLRYVRNYLSGGLLATEDQFPWTVYVNHKRSINATYLPQQFTLVPGYASFTGGRQFSPIGQLITLSPIYSPGWTEEQVDV